MEETHINTKNTYCILAVDDNAINRLLIKNVLKNTNYHYEILSNGNEVLESIKQKKPDLILMDLMMPNMNGLEVCSRIKSNPKFEDIPIIFLTASNEKEDILKAFDLGAADYVTKPFYPQELLARIKTHLELKKTRDELQKTLKEVKKLATTDTLTNIPNRRYFLSIAEREFSLAKRNKRCFSFLIIDIDLFKNINDNYGHLVGDEAIKLIAKTIIIILRKEDILARWGGEEFVVFLCDINPQSALVVAERIRKTIEDLSLNINGEKIKITVSIGIASFDEKDQNIDNVFNRADKGLYLAKNNGRNQVIFYEQN